MRRDVVACACETTLMAALRASTRETALAVTTSRVAGRAMMMMTAGGAKTAGRRTVEGAVATCVVACVAHVLGACAWFVAAGAFAGKALATLETARGTWRASRALSATTTTAFALARGDDDGDERAAKTTREAVRAYGEDARRVFVDGRARTARETSARAAALGSVAGAWCGACATALDWDRAWLTNSVLGGIELGHFVGACAACACVVLKDVLGLDSRLAAKTKAKTKAS